MMLAGIWRGEMQGISRYYEGMRAGIRRFAWWKDGVEYVGSCGTTLKEALEEVDKEEKKELAKQDM
jgi:hypothetical protein